LEKILLQGSLAQHVFSMIMFCEYVPAACPEGTPTAKAMLLELYAPVFDDSMITVLKDEAVRTFEVWPRVPYATPLALDQNVFET
jgi:hypothetical protein